MSVTAQGAGLAFPSDIDVELARSRFLISGKAAIANSYPYSGKELAGELGYDGRLAGTEFKGKLVFGFNPSVIGTSNGPGIAKDPSANPKELLFLDTLPNFTEIGGLLSGGDEVSAKVKLGFTVRPDWFSGEDLIAPWLPDAILSKIVFHFLDTDEGWVSAAGDHAWIAAGRFKSGIGEGHFGNTFLNGKANWYDQVQTVVHGDKLRFMALVGTSQTHLSDGEAAIQFKTDAAGNRYAWDPINDHDASTSIVASKVFAYRTLDFKPFDFARFGISEMNIIGGKVPELLDILPVDFWHDAYTAGYSNVMLGFNGSVVPLKGLVLFGEYTIDDVKGPDESVDAKPSQNAWQAGGRFSFEPARDLVVTVGGEYTETSEWAYCRWQPYLTMYQRQLLNGGWDGIDQALGYVYGPDAKHLGLFARAVLPNKANFELGYEYLVKGPISMGMKDANGFPIYYDYDTRSDYDDFTGGKTRPTSLDEIRARPDQLSHSLSLQANYPLGLGFDALARVQYTMYSNYGNASGDDRDVLYYSIGARFKY